MRHCANLVAKDETANATSLHAWLPGVREFVLFPIRGAETSAQSRRPDREVTMSWVTGSIVGGGWRNATWQEVFNLAGLAAPLDCATRAGRSRVGRISVSYGTLRDFMPT